MLNGGFFTFNSRRVHTVTDRIGNHLELALLLHLGEVLGGQVEGDVGVATLHQRAAVAGGRDRAPDDFLQFRQLAPDPSVIALIDGFDAGLPAHHLIGAGAGGVALSVFKRPRILLLGMLLEQAGIVDAGHDHREIGNGKAVLLNEVYAESRVVDGNELLIC